MRTVKGITLLELVIVLVIIGILATIGYTKLGPAANSLQDSGAKQSVSAIAGSEEVYFKSRGGFLTDSSQLTTLDSAYTYSSPSTSEKIIDTATSNSYVPSGASSGISALAIAAKSQSGRCYGIIITSPYNSYKAEKLWYDTSATQTCLASYLFTASQQGTGRVWQ